jgi:DNA-binding transcriptional LysR family regulator
MKKIDTNLLEIYVLAVEKKSLTQAGMELGLVVSAVSKRIAELERHTGKTLLRRHGRGIVPTPAGELLYLHAKAILRSLRTADEALAEFGNDGLRKIRLLANQSTIMQFLPAQIANYMARAEGTPIELIEGRSVDVPRMVSAGDADVGIYHAQHPAVGVVSYPYRKDRVCLVVPKGHPLERRKAIHFEEALDYPLLGPFPRYSLDHFMQLAGSSLSRPPAVRFSVSNFEARCRMVKEGVGIALLPENVARGYVSFLGLSMLRVEDAWAERQFYGCIRQSGIGGSHVQDLLMQLCEPDA